MTTPPPLSAFPSTFGPLALAALAPMTPPPLRPLACLSLHLEKADKEAESPNSRQQQMQCITTILKLIRSDMT